MSRYYAQEPDDKSEGSDPRPVDRKAGGVTWQLSSIQNELLQVEQAWDVLRERLDPVVDSLSPVPAMPDDKAPEPPVNSGLSSELLAIRSRISDLLYQMVRFTGSIDL